MIVAYFLMWVITTDAGDQWFFKAEPSLEACQMDGEAMLAESDAAKDAKEISDFHGHCAPAPDDKETAPGST